MTNKIYQAGLHFTTSVASFERVLIADDDPTFMRKPSKRESGLPPLTRLETRNPFSSKLTLITPFEKCKDLTFLAFPKNATMAFRNCGLFSHSRSTPSHCGRDVNWGEHFLICIFRDPVSRFISSFHWEMDHGFAPSNPLDPDC